MKKIVMICVLSLLVSPVAWAEGGGQRSGQMPPGAGDNVREVHQDRKDVRQDHWELKGDRRELYKDATAGDKSEFKDDMKEYNEDYRELHGDKRQLKDDRQDLRKEGRDGTGLSQERIEKLKEKYPNLTGEQVKYLTEHPGRARAWHKYKGNHPDATVDDFKNFVQQKRQQMYERFKEKHPDATQEDFQRFIQERRARERRFNGSEKGPGHEESGEGQAGQSDVRQDSQAAPSTAPQEQNQ